VSGVSASDLATIIVALTGLVAALAAFVSALRVVPKVDAVHQLVNSQSEKLNTAIGKAEFLAGVAEGVRKEHELNP